MSKFKLVRSIPLAVLAAGAIFASGAMASADTDTDTDSITDVRSGESTAKLAPKAPAPMIGYGTPIGGGG